MNYNNLPPEMRRMILQNLDRQSSGRMSQVDRESRDTILEERDRELNSYLGTPASVQKMISFVRDYGSPADKREMVIIRGRLANAMITETDQQPFITRLKNLVNTVIQNNPQITRQKLHEEFLGRGKNKASKAKSNPWLSHVAKVRAKYPNMSYKDCLVKAKESYKK